MSVVKPCRFVSPTPGTSHTLGDVPCFRFSAGIGFSYGVGSGSGPGGSGGTDDAPVPPICRHSCVRHVAVPLGPQAWPALTAATVTLAPPGPPVTAIGG